MYVVLMVPWETVMVLFESCEGYFLIIFCYFIVVLLLFLCHSLRVLIVYNNFEGLK